MNVPLPQHHPRGDGSLLDFLQPMRPIIIGDDDDVVFGGKPREEVNPCVLCYGHPDMDKCIKYRSIAERIHRVRDINFTLHCANLPQMCPTCFQRLVLKAFSHVIESMIPTIWYFREWGHTYSHLCQAFASCIFCEQPSHYGSLCSSAVHVYNLGYLLVSIQI